MITVKSIEGPAGPFLYLHGSHPDYPHCDAVRSVALSSLASGALTVPLEKAALIATVEQNILNWNAAQAALGEL